MPPAAANRPKVCVRLPEQYADEVERRLQAVLDHYDHFGLVTVAHMDSLLSAVLPELYADPPLDRVPTRAEPGGAWKAGVIEGRRHLGQCLWNERDHPGAGIDYETFLLAVGGTKAQRKEWRRQVAARREPRPGPAKPPPPAPARHYHQGMLRFDDGTHDDLFASPCVARREYNPAEKRRRKGGDDTDDGEANARRRKVAACG